MAQKGSELKIAFHGIEVCCSFKKKQNKTKQQRVNLIKPRILISESNGAIPQVCYLSEKAKNII